MNFKKFKHIWEKNSARILRFGYRKGKKKIKNRDAENQADESK